MAQNLEIESRRYATLHVLHLLDGSFALLDQSRNPLGSTFDPEALANLVREAQPRCKVMAQHLRQELEVLQNRGRALGLVSRPTPKPIVQLTLEDLGL
jgi:hypothetical protein